MNKNTPETRNSNGMMRSLADMPKPVLVLEAIGIILLIVVLLVTNNYLTLPEPLMQQGVIVAMIFIGIGCLIPAMINIIWRAVHGLSFLGIDNKQPSKSQARKNEEEED
ncbi:DUF1418 domain-containing protein [Providencia heimbachae]|uniref:YbjC family protein n=1 Tax=Providencia heimbachae TaxID=333962 RepID=UPI0010BE6B73|nr:YbjC family protein [Providencia heimbachae]QCJ70957.1 DUF1418 domain-containing protein [Providencia heimbachae]